MLFDPDFAPGPDSPGDLAPAGCARAPIVRRVTREGHESRCRGENHAAWTHHAQRIAETSFDIAQHAQRVREKKAVVARIWNHAFRLREVAQVGQFFVVWNDVDRIGGGKLAAVLHGIVRRLDLKHPTCDEVPVLIEESVEVIAIHRRPAFVSEVFGKRPDTPQIAPSRHRESARDAPEPHERSRAHAPLHPRPNRCGHGAHCGRVRAGTASWHRPLQEGCVRRSRSSSWRSPLELSLRSSPSWPWQPLRPLRQFCAAQRSGRRTSS